MTIFQDQTFFGERQLFALKNSIIQNVTFGVGESPLKESKNIKISNSVFKWKYPLWYATDIIVNHSIFEKMARSGIWYTENCSIINSTLKSPKLFRHSKQITLEHCYFEDASETLWSCRDVQITNVKAQGDYFGMNSTDISLNKFHIIGNYVFDGGKNIEARDCSFISKDAFWNCKNVYLEDCEIQGEYFGWNTENLQMTNCTISSNQGLCYIKKLKMKNCRLIETDLAFEYCSDLNVEINSNVSSIKNPISGVIKASHIDEIILNDPNIDLNQIKIIEND